MGKSKEAVINVNVRVAGLGKSEAQKPDAIKSSTPEPVRVRWQDQFLQYHGSVGLTRAYGDTYNWQQRTSTPNWELVLPHPVPYLGGHVVAE